MHRLRSALAVVALASCATVVPAIASGPNAVARPQPRGLDPVSQSDFDGDGFQDLAVGAPTASVGSVDGGGIVFVFYGKADGLSTDRVQLWHQDVSGIAFAPSTDGHFGAALAAGDFDKDGTADLAIGAPGQNRFIGGSVRNDAGLVEVIFGTDGVGLTADGDVAITPTRDQNFGEPQSLRWVGSDFGSSLVALDVFDTTAPVNVAPDGFADLAIGAPGYDGDRGLVVVLPGEDIAPAPVFDLFLSYSNTTAAGDRHGTSLAAGDFNGQGFDELAVGCPSCEVTSGPTTFNNAGKVDVFRIIDGFPTVVTLAEGTGANTTPAATNDLFGTALASGDFDGDGFDELAVGVPGKNVGGSVFAGMVQIYTGTANSLSFPVPTVHENQAAIPTDSVSLERFGHSLAVGDFGRGSGLDLAIGAPGERIGTVSRAGGAFVLYNTGSGLSSNGSQRWTQNTTGIPNKSEDNDALGDALTVGQFGRGTTKDLIIGAPLEDLPGNNATANAGLIHVLYGSSTGLTAANDQVFNMNTPGMPGLLADARFGDVLR